MASSDELAAAALQHLRGGAFVRETRLARERFAAARPFPHATIDDALPEWLLRRVDEEFPEDVAPSECRRLGRRLGWHCTMQGRQGGFLKLGVALEAVMGNASRALLRVMKSAEFTRSVEMLTGIEGLTADPHNVGSGLHQILPNGSLQVHADNNHGLDVARYSKLPSDHPLHGGRAERRVNLFLYLNSGWRAEWGGALELWPRNLSSCEARILPRRNRFVAFASTDFSYHGHPTPLACPPGRSRRSLAVYYYTASHNRPRDEVDTPERRRGTATIYKDPGRRCGGEDPLYR
jgi:hypothetical protein